MVNGNRSQRGHGIKLLHWNKGPSFLINKHQEVETIVADHKPHVLGLSEANLKREHDQSLVQHQDYILHTCDTIAARRVVGLTPIEPMILDIQQQSYGAKNKQEAMYLEAKNYLKCELKIPPSVIAKLNIVSVFHPAKDDWKTLYIELGSEQEVDTIYSYTRNIMKRDHRVFPYLPKEMYRRYRAAESFLFNVRHEEKLKTKVKIGQKDLILLTKVPGSLYWRKCPVS